MLGQLNHGQTRLPLPSLDFGDRDLTDGFTDVRDGSHSSISGFGHPRGSTPVSVLSSRRSTTSTALSGESPESRRVLPNVSALLEFLDNDNNNPFPHTSSSSNRKSKKNPSHRSSRSPPPSSPSVNPHGGEPKSLTPRSGAADLDLTSNFLNTYDGASPFRGALPTSSTPFTNQRDDFSEISSPLNKRHHLPSGLQANLPPLQFSHPMATRQKSNSPAFKQAPETYLQHHSPQSERPASRSLPTETPARLPPKAPSAADRLAAAVMEGAPESHWTFLMERRSSENATGIRRSKVVEELLQPMRPSLSCPGKQTNRIPDAIRSIQDSDLPQSLIDETRRAPDLPSRSPQPTASEPIVGRSRLTKSAGYSSPPDLIRPIPQRQPFAHAAVGPDYPFSANEQVEVLDARVNQLLTHIRSDQLEKANLASALTEARAEVAALREEVRLLRIGVQKLGADRPHQSADARLERRRHQISPARVELEKPLSVVPPARPQQTSARQRRISLEALLNEITLPNPITDKDEQLNLSPPQHRLSPFSASHLKSNQPELSKKMHQKVSVKLPSHQEALFQGPEGSRGSGIKDLTQHFLGDLALGLTFTRCVDQLVMSGTGHASATGGVPEHAHRSSKTVRPDAEIFTPDNLDRLFCRLKVWKQLVLRTSQPASHHLPPLPPLVPDSFPA
ncbi:hypothetical protein PCASD_12880 [Puccinia coronata f. sp. avenae]|uniref:Uncharacterized protein n=1 Tax=Puccinia coronata f. sp. avenae TaxID=200324 RepID=A0A2N5T8V0_9BASI|nr:hypothetical protein PCASD_12880 [Puccinia coronata f. sp. avenae]